MVAAARVAAEPTTDDIESKIRAAHDGLKACKRELDDAERELAYAERRTTSHREEAQRRRVELGRLLLGQRSRWPERGPNAKGWGEFLRGLEIDPQSAREWMDLAEEIEVSKPDDDGLEMTRAKVRAAKTERDTTIAPRTPNHARNVKNEDHARRKLRVVIKQMVAGGHSPDLLAVELGEWTEYVEEHRRLVCADLAAELRALAVAVEQLP